MLFVFVVFISNVSASDSNEMNVTLTEDISAIELNEIDSVEIDNDGVLSKSEDCDEIVVNDWEELQYYCSLSDKDYTLKLKEDTNFYPSNHKSSSNQIKINNNVKIIGSPGSYFGDESWHHAYISGGYPKIDDGEFVEFTPLVVSNNLKKGVTFENITFKWMYILDVRNEGIFLEINGGSKNSFKNCTIEDSYFKGGSGSFMHLKRGSASLDNCSFVNCTVSKGCINVYSGRNMVVRNCLFENNFAAEHSTCIMNFGNLLVYNSKFYKNRSSAWAGGITTYRNGNTTIYDSEFKGNLAGWNGGALYCYNILNVYNTVFEDNNCTTNNGGGAIGACQFEGIPRMYVDGCLFKNNNNLCWALDSLSTTGTGRGGAISFMDVGSIEVRNTVFVANSASWGTAICAIGNVEYGSPDIIIVNNTFINHTKVGDVLAVHVLNTLCNVSDNFYLNNSIRFSKLELSVVGVGKDQATLKVDAHLSNPSYYDADILDRTLYDVFINNEYVKTVNSTIFTIDFGDLDICDVYVVPTISNRKTNEITVASTREYIFVSKNLGNDSNNGSSRSAPVSTIKKALELAKDCQSIILLDGFYSEENLEVDYDVLIKGENGATLTGVTSFILNDNLTLKNMNMNKLNTSTFIKQNHGHLSVYNCVLSENKLSVLFDCSDADISKSVLINNDALLIRNNGFSQIRDSIVLNNSDIIQGNNNYNLDYNWWGSTLSDLSKPNLNITNWLIFNVSSDNYVLEQNQIASMDVSFYLNDSSSKYVGLPGIDFDISSLNGVILRNYEFKQTGLDDGVVTFKYNDVAYNVTFEFLKSNPDVSIKSENIMFGDKLTVQLSFPDDVTGNITIGAGNFTQTLEANKNLMALFTGLKAGDYTINVSYSGDRKYLSQTTSFNISVLKHISQIDLDIGQINVGENLVLSITTSKGTTGNVTVKINNEKHSLSLNESRTNYTIKNIARGDYLITAVYDGDEKYLSSDVSTKIEVDNIMSNMEISVDDIVYGEAAVINIILNDNATGNVTVTVDGIAKTSEVINGNAKFEIPNLDAGNKTVTVFYTGDDTYFNMTSSSTFMISKANLTFSISSEDIKIGREAVVHITVPAKTGGTFTIGDEVITIPLSGDISYVLYDLAIGEYEITAKYAGNNYNDVSNSTSFTVSEYPASQWANDGFDTKNTGKSSYNSSSNGEVSFKLDFDKDIVGSILIDSEGNFYVSTNEEVYSFNKSGDVRWIFTNNDVIGNFSGMSISRDIISIPKSGDTLFFINQSNGARFDSSNIYQASSIYSPIVDSNANLYVSSEYHVTSEDYKLVIVPFRMWESGGTPIMVNLGKVQSLASPTVGEEIIVILGENRLMVLDASSYESIFIKTDKFAPIRPIIGEGNIVYAVLGDSVVAYSISGLQLWKTNIPYGVGNSLVLDNEQGLYVTNKFGNIYKFDVIDGEAFLMSSLNFTSDILIDVDGNLYAGSGEFLYALDSMGNILWKSDVDFDITGKPVMDENGTIYVSGKNNLASISSAPLKDPNITVSACDVAYGEDVNIEISIDNLTFGEVSIIIDGIKYTERINDGRIIKTFSNLKSGNHTVEVVYGGDLRFMKSSESVNFTVHSLDPNLAGSVSDVNVGESVVFNVNLNKDATGKVSVVIDNVTYEANAKLGSSKITVRNLPAGNYTYVLTYSGDDKYSKTILTGNISIFKLNTNLAVLSSDINVGDVESIVVTMPSAVSGNIHLNISNKQYNATVVRGSALIKIPDLGEGVYDVVVRFTGEKYADCENSTAFTVSKVKLNKDVLTVTNGVVYTISLPSDAGGTLTVSVNDNDYVCDVVGGVAQIVHGDLTPGNYTASVSYSGDNKYEAIKFDDFFISIDKLFSDISVSAQDIDVGETVSISVTLTPIDECSVTVNVNNKNYSVEIKNGKGSLNISDLGFGNYSVVVRYAGDDTYMSCVNTTSFNVFKVNLPVTNETIVIPDDNLGNYSISLPDDATGTLTVTVDDKEYCETLVNGKATVNIPELGEGSHNITVTYSGDGKYAPSSKSSVVVINPVNLTENNTAVVDNSTSGNTTTGNDTGNVTNPVNVLDEAFVIPESGNEYSISLPDDATGSLTVTVDGVPYSQNITNGKATVNIPELGEGSHNITVTYSGDGKYAPSSKSSVVVKEHIPVMMLAGSNLSMLYSSGKYFKVRLISDGQPLGGKTVKITIDGQTYYRIADDEGYASIKISLAPKTYTIKATYGNLTVTKKVTVKSIITAKNINSKRSAKTVKIKVTLKKVNGKYLKNKKLTLKFNKKTFKAKTNKKGIATFTIKNSVYKNLKVNKKYTYQVLYGKDKVKKTIKFKK